jgi:hypothetical protein
MAMVRAHEEEVSQEKKKKEQEKEEGKKFEQRWQKKAEEIPIWDQPEYRIEFEAVGQGHYHRLPNDELAIEKARHLSIDYPGEVVVLEQFKPVRRLIGWYERGKEVKNPEQTRKFEDRWKKKAEMIKTSAKKIEKIEISKGH